MSEHTTTTVDGDVRGYPGTIATCSCGWRDAWAVMDGSAESSAHFHRLSHDPEAKRDYDEQMRLVREANVQRDAERVVQPVREGAPIRERCHPCSCHLHPPCGACENCAHADHPECGNDCQTCEEYHDDY